MSAVHLTTHMYFKPSKIKRLMNIYPPYLGAGVSVTHISDDYRELHVKMKLSWYNKNIVGTHFGGSLYSMVDPHLMLMLMQILGREYIVWDQAASINFIKATKNTVTAKFNVSEEQLEDIRENTQGSKKYLPEFSVDIVDSEGTLVAQATKILYIKRKRHASSPKDSDL